VEEETQSEGLEFGLGPFLVDTVLPRIFGYFYKEPNQSRDQRWSNQVLGEDPLIHGSNEDLSFKFEPYGVRDYLQAGGYALTTIAYSVLLPTWLRSLNALDIGAGFDIPFDPWNVPVPIRIGGVRPPLTQQIDEIVHGSAGGGFYLFGEHIEGGDKGLPWTDFPLIRSHASALIVFAYRNTLPQNTWFWDPSDDVINFASGLVLDFIHPGYRGGIDAETIGVAPRISGSLASVVSNLVGPSRTGPTALPDFSGGLLQGPFLRRRKRNGSSSKS
jgi:hypothetical protein